MGGLPFGSSSAVADYSNSARFRGYRIFRGHLKEECAMNDPF